MEYYWDNSDEPQRSLDWVHTNEHTYPEVFGKLGLKPNDVKSLFDGGSGYGASLLIAGRYFKKAQLYACSIGETPTDAVTGELGNRLHFSQQEIEDYLKSKTKKYDLIVLSYVPGHGIISEDDYQLLANRMDKNGHLLEFGDTGLNRVKMLKYFDHVNIDSSPMLEAWKKK